MFNICNSGKIRKNIDTIRNNRKKNPEKFWKNTEKSEQFAKPALSALSFCHVKTLVIFFFCYINICIYFFTLKPPHILVEQSFVRKTG